MTDKDASLAVRISINVERANGTYSKLENWIVPNVIAEEILCSLVDHENRWSGSIKEVKDYLDSIAPLKEFLEKKSK